MSDIYPTPCEHSPDGVSLCRGCQVERDTDPTAWEEYGYHPRGLANYANLLEETRGPEPIAEMLAELKRGEGEQGQDQEPIPF